ncbi:flagellar motor switch protein FliG [Erythrobacter sp. W53]|uniref:flagellar motor switch protein FliG n=1 Tax=Erythrobacter sp. W53 TaxID=3425947 RepID=UPI003D766E88
MTGLAQFSQAECAAVFLMLLDDDQAAGLLGRLQPDQLERVGSIMCELEDIQPHKIAHAIAGFVAEAETETLAVQDREEKVEALLKKAVGPVKSESLMQRIQPDAAPKSIEIARWLAPSILSSLLEEEHPQVVAVLLLLLDPEKAAQVLAGLPSDAQPLIVERIARLNEVPGEAVAMLDQLLSAGITRRFGSAAMKVGGARDAANLINLTDPDVGQTILPNIEQRDGELAKAIEEEMFTFEMLLELSPKDMGRLLRDVDNEHLIRALKGVSEDEQAPFFAAMSSRAADGIRDEMDLLPKLKRPDVLDAQKQVVDVARKLSDEGEIELGASDGEFI